MPFLSPNQQHQNTEDKGMSETPVHHLLLGRVAVLRM